MLCFCIVCAVDFSRPISSLIPGSTGRILDVLVSSSDELNLTTVADLARVSTSQASRVLPHLVQLGVVSRHDVPPSSLFSLNRDHVAAKPLMDLLHIGDRLADVLADLAAGIEPAPVNVTLFGSAARGQATASSDIDIVVVRPRGIEDADESWSTTLADWSEAVLRSTGNHVNVVEIGEDEVGELIASRRPVWRSIVSEGRTVAGTGLTSLAA
jgi:hypothetical protein